MIRSAKKSIAIHTTDRGLKRKVKIFSGLLKEASDKGVNVKILAQDSLLQSKDKAVIKRFAQLKPTDIKARYIVVDNREILLMIGDEEVHPSYDLALWLTSPGFASTIQSLFEKEISN
jgi:sugar-specific transcriptional regulator TrmB